MLDTAPAVPPTCPTDIAVDLRGVVYGYDRRNPILKGIDMTIPRGKLVAIIQIAVPHKLSSKAKSLLKELKEELEDR